MPETGMSAPKYSGDGVVPLSSTLPGPTVYMTTQGGTDTTSAIRSSDARLGIESNWPTGDSEAAHFVDYPFTDPDSTFKGHLNVVRDHRPEIAVAPDIEGDRTLGGVVQKGDRLLDAGADAVVIVPKTVRPQQVPERFRVGVPAADFGSGAPWGVWHYRQCGPVHILGGPPSRQLEIGRHLRVASVDTATLGKRCRFGTWDRNEGAVDAPDGWDYRRRLRHALNEYAARWRSH